MRRLFSGLMLALVLTASALPAAAHATLTRVKTTHAAVTRHKAHKAGRHHRSKHRRAHRRST